MLCREQNDENAHKERKHDVGARKKDIKKNTHTHKKSEPLFCDTTKKARHCNRHTSEKEPNRKKIKQQCYDYPRETEFFAHKGFPQHAPPSSGSRPMKSIPHFSAIFTMAFDVEYVMFDSDVAVG